MTKYMKPSIDANVQMILEDAKKNKNRKEEECVYPRAWSVLASAIMKSAKKDNDVEFFKSDWCECINELATFFVRSKSSSYVKIK